MDIGYNKQKDEYLISFVRCNSVLYDASNRNYKNNIFKHKIWERISEALDMPVIDVKKRWKHLRDHYNKKVKLANKGIHQNSWENMSLLTFLSNVPSQQSTCTNEEPKFEIIQPETDIKGEIQNVETLPAVSYLSQVTDVYHSDQNTEDETTEDQNITNNDDDTSEGPSKEKRKKRTNTTLVAILERKEIENAALYAKLAQQEYKTPVKKFFDSMADIVAKFPPHLAAEARLQVCQAVTELEIKALKEQEKNMSSRVPSSSEDPYLIERNVDPIAVDPGVIPKKEAEDDDEI